MLFTEELRFAYWQEWSLLLCIAVCWSCKLTIAFALLGFTCAFKWAYVFLFLMHMYSMPLPLRFFIFNFFGWNDNLLFHLYCATLPFTIFEWTLPTIPWQFKMDVKEMAIIIQGPRAMAATGTSSSAEEASPTYSSELIFIDIYCYSFLVVNG